MGIFHMIWLTQPKLKIANFSHAFPKGEMGCMLCVIQTKEFNRTCDPLLHLLGSIENMKNICNSRVKRLDSSTCLHAVGNKAVEFFFASDAR